MSPKLDRKKLFNIILPNVSNNDDIIIPQLMDDPSIVPFFRPAAERGFIESEYIILSNSKIDSLIINRGAGTGAMSNTGIESLANMNLFGYGASRTFGAGSLAEDEIPGNHSPLFDESIPLANPEEWLLQTDYASRQNGKFKNLYRSRFNQVRDSLLQILPDVEDIKISPPTESRKTARAEFRTPYGWVPLSGMGLGYRTMTAWMVDLASRLFDTYPDSPDPLAEPAVVLVDEIDLHMHPRWQRTIIDYLSERFPKTQFIVTAHSPLIVQSAKDANIVVLRRIENPDGDDYVVIDNDPEIVANWRVDQILTSLFDLETARPKEVEPLLKERRKILGKPKLTQKDKARLRALNKKIGALPTGETPEDIEAMDIIRQAAAALQDEPEA